MRAFWSVVLMAALALSGCLANDSQPYEGEANTVDDHEQEFEEENLGFEGDEGPEGEPASGTPAEHGEPRIDEGNVGTKQSDNSPYWESTQVITIDNDFGGADNAVVGISVPVGSIRVVPSPDGDYHYTLTLVGIGGTAVESEQALESIEWSHEDDLDGRLLLRTIVERDGPNGISCSGVGPLARCSGTSYRAHLVAELPAGPAFEFEVGSSTADIDMNGFGGPRLSLVSSTGDITATDLAFAEGRIESSTGEQIIDGAFDAFHSTASTGDFDSTSLQARDVSIDRSTGDIHIRALAAETATFSASTGDLRIDDGLVERLTVETSSGSQQYDLRTHDVHLRASTGDITGTFDPQQSGEITVVTSSGEVTLDLDADGDHGYDVRITTSTGDINAEVDGQSSDEDAESFRAITSGYESRDVRTAVVIETSTGDVTVDA